MTTLSYGESTHEESSLTPDGTFVSYLKAARGWDDAFVAIMRVSAHSMTGLRQAVCVLTGLFGTIIMPWLERRIGVERAGAWSIWWVAVALALTPGPK